MWRVATTNVFDDWFAELDEDAQAELIAKVELLKVLGPRLARPHADTLNGSKHANMKELRAERAKKSFGLRSHSIQNERPCCWLPVISLASVKSGFTDN